MCAHRHASTGSSSADAGELSILTGLESKKRTTDNKNDDVDEEQRALLTRGENQQQRSNDSVFETARSNISTTIRQEKSDNHRDSSSSTEMVLQNDGNGEHVLIVNEEETSAEKRKLENYQSHLDYTNNHLVNRKGARSSVSTDDPNNHRSPSISDSIDRTVSIKFDSGNDTKHVGFENMPVDIATNKIDPSAAPSPLAQAQISTSSIRTSIMNSHPPWPTTAQLENFANTEKRKKTKKYYRQQVDLVRNFQEDEEFVQKFQDDEDLVKREMSRDTVKRSDDILAKLSLFCNVLLLAGKATAAGLSGSLVVIGTVVDSATDITTGLVIYLTNRAILKRDLYKYPRGRTRLQPIALVIISVIMGACSVQVISKSIESIATGKLETDIELPTILIMVCTIVIKFVLMIVCYMYRSPSSAVLAQDHRNDVISNSVALVCAYLSFKYWKYLDPIAAIVVSCYILITWLRTGNEHVKTLSGKAAKPEFINRIIKICLDHRPALNQIDTVYAYYYGTKFLVEIDVVLDANLSLKDAHDIAEPLQRKIEHLPDVERAFVHIDYETDHRPDYEHKVV